MSTEQVDLQRFGHETPSAVVARIQQRARDAIGESLGVAQR